MVDAYDKWLQKYERKTKAQLKKLIIASMEWDRAWIPHQFCFIAHTPKKKALLDAYNRKR